MKHFLYGFSLLIFSAISYAQPGAKIATKKISQTKATYFDLNVNVGIPQNSFASTTTSLPAGISLNILHQPNRRTPFQFGGGFAYLSAGSKTIDKNLSADIFVGTTLIDQLIIPLEFRIRNSILNGHAMIRLQFPNGLIRPYIDLVGGFNYLWTNTSLFDRSGQNYFSTDDNNRIFSKSQSSDLTWSAGGGLGLMVRLNAQMFLNLSATYMYGGRVNYFDKNQIDTWNIELNSSLVASEISENSLNEEDVTINALPKRSKTDMLMIQAGVSLPLNSSPNNSKTKPGAQSRLK
jgi:hypothetical protein